MKKTWIIGLLILILSVAAVSKVISSRQQSLPTPKPSSDITANQTAEVNEQVIPGMTGLRTFSDPQGVFVFRYPNDYTLDTEDALHPRIYKRGEMQRPQSEMSDGALVVFEKIELEGKTLEQWVDARIAESVASGTGEVVQPKKPSP